MTNANIMENFLPDVFGTEVISPYRYEQFSKWEAMSQKPSDPMYVEPALVDEYCQTWTSSAGKLSHMFGMALGVLFFLFK